MGKKTRVTGDSPKMVTTPKRENPKAQLQKIQSLTLVRKMFEAKKKKKGGYKNI